MSSPLSNIKNQTGKDVEFNMDFCIFLLKSRGADNDYAKELCGKIKSMHENGEIPI